MDKLKMHTPNLTDENFKKLVALFPNAVTETINENGEVVRAVDADVLRQEISATVVEGKQERYQFTWPDKKKSVILANQPTSKTLRLVREKSVGRDGTPGSIDTENIYIEGDNLDALKILQETYLGKVKMIYIDPPYNTGNDFIYEDDFSQRADEYLSNSGQSDEEGNRLVQNSESNGRFHTDWLNMMYPRLRLAKDLLSDDGVIFISIDDNEDYNAEKIMNDIFGENNFITKIVWEKVHTRKNSAIYFSSSHEYILCYAKVKRNNSTENKGFKRNLLPRENNKAYSNPDNDPKGPWKLDPITAHNYYSANYAITKPNGVVVHRPKDRYWTYSEETIKKMISENAIVWGEGDSLPMVKRYLCDVQDGLVPVTIFSREFAGDSSQAKKNLDELFVEAKGIFDYTKPIQLMKRLLQIGTNDGDIVLDFFSGSASMAQAVIELNEENNEQRHFVMVQIPEATPEESVAYLSGYKSITDIGEERIRRVSKKCKTSTDAGFRVFKIDSSNMKDVYYKPNDYGQEQIDLFADNIKEDRSSEDLLFQIMLDLGVLLSSKIEELIIESKKVFSVANDYLIACFDSDVTDDVVREIAKRKPFYAVFRDSSIASDSVATNFEQIFETYSPDTVRKVL